MLNLAVMRVLARVREVKWRETGTRPVLFGPEVRISQLQTVNIRIQKALSKRSFAWFSDDVCVYGYLDVFIIRCYRRHNNISGVNILEFASD